MTNEEMEKAIEKGIMTNELAIKLLSETELSCMYEEQTYEALDLAIKALKQELKIGRWEEVQFRTIPYNRISKAKKCSVCGKRKDKYVTWNYCPNCGCRMIEPQKERIRDDKGRSDRKFKTFAKFII